MWVLELFVAAGIIAILIAMLIPAVRSSPSAAKRVRCANNLRQLARAVLIYDAAHGNLPPAYTADENENPMHSWRQLISSTLDVPSHPPSKYTLDESWNSAKNQKTETEFKRVFGDAFLCPKLALENDQSKSALTCYRLVTGPSTLFLNDTPPSLSDIADDPSQKILLIEVPSLIPARQPKDISVEEAIDILAPANPEQTTSNHRGGTQVAMFDGSVRYLPFAEDERTRAEYIQALRSAVPNSPVENQ